MYFNLFSIGKYIFVSDFLNDRVLRFDFATKQFKDVFVQKGSGGLRGPWGIAFNKYDDPAQPRTFYVSSEGTSRSQPFCDLYLFAHSGGCAASCNMMLVMVHSLNSLLSCRVNPGESNSTCCHLLTIHLASRKCFWYAVHIPTAFLSTTP